MDLPESFPALPGPGPPSLALARAHQDITRNYQKCLDLLLRDDSDPLRLRFHIQQVEGRMFPLFTTLTSENLSSVWLETGAHILGRLLLKLTEAANGAETQDVSTRVQPRLITISNEGAGRPTKHINLEWVREATSKNRRIPLKSLAGLLGIHRNTLAYKLREVGLHRRFTDIQDEDLDRILRMYKHLRPESGLRYTSGFLQAHGLKIQRQRVRESLKRVDGVGRALRHHDAIERRKYASRYSNAVWHMDGMHKLILWGFVIHGAVDGHDHMVVALRASTNNKASTVLGMFQDSVAEYGCPSRVRGDRGGENLAVAVWMIMRKGPSRASFIWGSSTRNTRIERLWVEVATQFARRWRAFFFRLERLHFLDRQNSAHLWLLQHIFLGLINTDCDAFRRDWNYHPLSSNGNQSPADLRFVNQAQSGLDTEEYADVHPDVLDRYYNVDGEPVHRDGHRTGAGHPPDEEADEIDDPIVSDTEYSDSEDLDGLEEIFAASSSTDNIDLQRQVAADICGNVHHRAVKVPRNHCPFNDPTHKILFDSAFADVRNANAVPSGYGVLSAEWDDDGYPDCEIITFGRRRKELVVDLPAGIWLPRAISWVQGLHVLQTLLYASEDN